MNEKETLLVEKQNLSERQNNWFEATTRAFDFACYAKHWFEHGDAKTKVSILNALGSNLTVMDRKLHIDGERAWFLIEKGKNRVQEVVDRFEPGKCVDLIEDNKVLKVASSSWLGELDKIRTFFLSNPLVTISIPDVSFNWQENFNTKLLKFSYA